MNVNTVKRDTSVNFSENQYGSEVDNNLYLSGFSEQVFNCLASICNGGGCSSQVTAVENIDKKYNLPAPKATNVYDITRRVQPLYPQADGQHKWNKLKVFISSTFEVSCYVKIEECAKTFNYNFEANRIVGMDIIVFISYELGYAPRA